MHYRIVSLAAAGAIALGAVSAQPALRDAEISNELNSNKIVRLDGNIGIERRATEADSLRRVISAFYYDQFRHFQDPGAPYFLFMSKDSQLAMGVGGCVRMRGYYDWAGAMPTSAFAPYMIPIPGNAADRTHFDTTPSGTCLYFRVIGRNKTLGNYQLYIEANFNGYQGRDFTLKKAYATVNDFTIGYAASTFSDPAAQPPVVDAQGANNKITPTAVLIRYMPVVKDRWYFAVSAETPQRAVGIDNVSTGKKSAGLPDFAAFVQYQWAAGQHVRLAGIYRQLGYRDLAASKNYNVSSGGLELSAVGNPLPQLCMYLTANYGKGIGGLGGDLIVGNYDLVGDAAQPGRMYAPRSCGLCAGASWYFRPNLFMTLVYSQNRYLPRGGAAADEYKYGNFGAVNVFWNITPRIQVAGEFDLGRRQNISGEHRYARRINAMCQFSF